MGQQPSRGHPVRGLHQGLRALTRVRTRELALLGVLLILPILALAQWPQAARWVAAWGALVGLLTWTLYALDKRQAGIGGRRISERTLHGCELAGGWPAAFLAQRHFRHKSAKGRYRLVFWGIVLLHQAIAAAALRGFPSPG
ncbi:MAG: DUF1294 domain-containing protein [Verrucomicrobiae bacterium]|nr:DUF1294 domain-containing protein [Verrucomicrobiae bacterium]